jgi:hypothetical protein
MIEYTSFLWGKRGVSWNLVPSFRLLKDEILGWKSLPSYECISVCSIDEIPQLLPADSTNGRIIAICEGQ